MSIAINDVAAFHEGLERSVDSASDDLVQQARKAGNLTVADEVFLADLVENPEQDA